MSEAELVCPTCGGRFDYDDVEVGSDPEGEWFVCPECEGTRSLKDGFDRAEDDPTEA